MLALLNCELLRFFSFVCVTWSGDESPHDGLYRLSIDLEQMSSRLGAADRSHVCDGRLVEVADVMSPCSGSGTFPCPTFVSTLSYRR